MKTLQQIKDEFARSKGYDDFDDILKSGHIFMLGTSINELLILVQKECLKNAKVKVFDDMEAEWNYEISSNDCEILEQSITNGNNIIK